MPSFMLLYTEQATLLYIKFYLGIDNSSYTILTKKELLHAAKLFTVLIVPAAILLYNIIKTIPSDAKSREEQDDS